MISWVILISLWHGGLSFRVMEWLMLKKWYWKHWFCTNHPMKWYHHTVEFWQRHPTRDTMSVWWLASTTNCHSSKLALSTAHIDKLKVTYWPCTGWEGRGNSCMVQHKTQMSSTILYGTVLRWMRLLVFRCWKYPEWMLCLLLIMAALPECMFLGHLGPHQY